MFKIFVPNLNNLIVVIWSIGKSEFWKKEVSLLETWQEITVVETFLPCEYHIILSRVRLLKELS